jgi:hypothetical protein
LTLVCGAAVANRYIHFYTTAVLGGAFTCGIGGSSLIAATQTASCNITPTVASTTLIDAGNVVIAQPIVVSDVETLLIGINVGTAGDTYSGYVVVREMAVD